MAKLSVGWGGEVAGNKEWFYPHMTPHCWGRKIKTVKKNKLMVRFKCSEIFQLKL